MLSEILRFRVMDRAGAAALITDLSVDIDGVDYPPIRYVYFVYEGKPSRLELDKGASLDHTRKCLIVESLSRSTRCPEPGQDREVLLRRDVLDALIIDLQNRRSTRATDLEIEEADGELILKSVDAGFLAMMRRLTRGVFGSVSPSALFDWKYIEFLRGDPAAVRNGAGYQMRIGRLPAGEIARLSDLLPYLHAAELIRLLPDVKSARVFQSMSIERQLQVIDELEEDEALDILSRMSADLAADVLGRVGPRAMKRYIGKMDKKRSASVLQLLSFPESSVGGAMVNNVLTLPGGLTIGEARYLVGQGLNDADFTSICFVVDTNKGRRLTGTLPLIDLLTTIDDRRVSDVMDPYIEVLGPFDDAYGAAHRIISAQLQAMPVTGADGRLLGAMTANSAISLIVPQSSSLQSLRVFS